MDFGTMKKRVAMRVQDPLMKILDDDLIGECVNDAVQDLSGCGWLLPLEEDESTELASNDYEYDVPDDFAYIRELRLEDDTVSPSVYDYMIPGDQWRLGYNGAVAAIIFDSRYFAFTSGDKVKVIGQKRPTEYSDDTTVIVAGMEPFIRERAICYAARTMAMLLPERQAEQSQAMEGESPPGTRIRPIIPDAEERRARRLMGLSERAWVNSEAFLANHPQEFRVKISSRHVPGR